MAESEAGIIGMMSIYDGWLDQLYVDPSCFGHGTGTRLLDLAKRLFPEGLDLWTFQSNLGARRFYETHGFRPLEETGGENEEGAPDVHYRWDG